MKIELSEQDFNEMVDLWINNKFYSTVYRQDAYIHTGETGDQVIFVQLANIDPTNKEND